MTLRGFIIKGNKKIVISPSKRHKAASLIPRGNVTMSHFMSHMEVCQLGRFLPIFGQFPSSWLVQTQYPWLWLVHSCNKRHEELQQFWSMSLFLEAHSLTGNSSGSNGFYRRSANITALTEHADTTNSKISNFEYIKIFCYLCPLYGDRFMHYN